MFNWKICCIVLVMTFLTFLPVLDNGFVNLDDEMTVTHNPYFRGLSFSHLKWMFTTHWMGHYQPLSWMSLGLDYLIWELNPYGYHLTNLVLHTVNAILACMVFYVLLIHVFPSADKGSLHWIAGGAALVFALHPLRVESVAWVTERRDVLSGVFYLLALLFYLRNRDRDNSSSSYFFSLIFFLLSMLSKAWGVTFVAVLLLLDAYPLRRFEKENTAGILLEKIPYLIITFPFIYAASWAQNRSGALRSLEHHGLIERIAQAGYGLCFYVYKTVWPFNLSPLYAMEEPLNPFTSLHITCFLIAVVTSLCMLVYYRKIYWLATGWFCYVVIVVPVLGFFQSGPQKTADRYTYLSCLPFALILSGLLWKLAQKQNTRIWLFGGTVIVLLFLAGLSFHQSDVWSSSETLWTHTISIDPENYYALYNMSNVYLTRDRIDDAMQMLRRALQVKPDALDALMNMGLLLARLHKYDESIREFEIVTTYYPRYAEAYYCIGLGHAHQNRYQDAITNYIKAIELDASYTMAHMKLADAYKILGKNKEADFHYRIAAQHSRDQAGN